MISAGRVAKKLRSTKTQNGWTIIGKISAQMLSCICSRLRQVINQGIMPGMKIIVKKT